MKKKLSQLFACIITVTALHATIAAATPNFQLCVDKKSNVSFRSSTKCLPGTHSITAFLQGLNGSTGPTGTAGSTGPQGPAGSQGNSGTPGTPGADGALRAYGTGDDGNVEFSSPQTFDAAKQYDNITIDSGVTLTVEAGTRIRCSGAFINNGTILVTSVGNGGYIYNPSNHALVIAAASAGAGFSSASGDNGEIVNTSDVANFGYGGYTQSGATTISATKAKAILFPLAATAGGGGGAAVSGNSGGSGGGLITILCKGTVTNSGTGIISAIGDIPTFGTGGGGAGGVVIVASSTSIVNSGTITVAGASGGAASANGGGGGGGGGGMVALAAPSVNNTGTITISGGAGASDAVSGTVTSATRQGGGGGGACGGQGGDGATVSGTASSGATSGGAGLSMTILADPTALFF